MPAGLDPLPPDLAAMLQQQPQVGLQVAQPMNDVQLIALVAGELVGHEPAGANIDGLLDLATAIVAGAYVRVGTKQFQRALDAAKARVAEA